MKLTRGERDVLILISGDGKWVPAKGLRQCFLAGKVTVGLASNWPCDTDSPIQIDRDLCVLAYRFVPAYFYLEQIGTSFRVPKFDPLAFPSP